MQSLGIIFCFPHEETLAFFHPIMSISTCSNQSGTKPNLVAKILTKEPTASPVFTKWWNCELMLATNLPILVTYAQMVTKVGSQNFDYQIWFCTKLLMFGIRPAGLILCMRPANERQYYSVTPSHWLGAYTEWALDQGHQQAQAWSIVTCGYRVVVGTHIVYPINHGLSSTTLILFKFDLSG